MEALDTLSHEQFLGNDWEHWAVAGGIFCGILLLCWLVKKFFVIRLRKFSSHTETLWDDAILQILENTRVYFPFMLALFFAVRSLNLHPKVDATTRVLFFFVLFFQIGLWANRLLSFMGNSYADKALETDAARATTVRAMLFFGKIIIWTIVFLLLLDNWGVKIAPFIAGLGVGGVAIALAVQNILGDLFASLSIVLDKPFVIGDSISVGTESGTVEYIGLKTTRVKSATGEQLIFSNSDLLQSRIRNFKRMQERRVLFTFGVIYETSPEKLHRVREIVREAVTSVKETRFERCHLSAFAASSLDYEVVYWVRDPDYGRYIDIHHQVAVQIIASFAKEEIEFAYPTQMQLTKETSVGNSRITRA